MDKKLYFISIVPHSPLYEEVHGLKAYFRDHYQSRKALNSPPHITLQMPFKWREDREDQIMELLQNITDSHSPFELQLDGFGFFEPRVVYVNCVESPALIQLQKSVATSVRQRLKLVNERGERPFRPHMTIAFRDLKKPKFYMALEEFKGKEFKRTFPVEDIALLKHNGRHWEIRERLPFTRKE